MSNFREPPGDKAPPSRFGSELDSSQKPAHVNPDDIPPVSSRFDRFASSGPLSTRAPGHISSTATLPRTPSTGSFAAASPPGRGTKGGIYQLTKIIEKKHGAFFISRVILASGINLRGYNIDSIDDHATLMKFIATVRNMLSPTEMADIITQAPSLLHSK